MWSLVLVWIQAIMNNRMHLCCCKDSVIKGSLGNTMFCASRCLLFLISGLLIVHIYLNMASTFFFSISIRIEACTSSLAFIFHIIYHFDVEWGMCFKHIFNKLWTKKSINNMRDVGLYVYYCCSLAGSRYLSMSNFFKFKDYL
jgi:hypothetical protein